MNLSSCFVVLFISLVNGKALPQGTEPKLTVLKFQLKLPTKINF